MAKNVNYVEVAGEALIDLRPDTVTSETLAKGVTAHDASGTQIVGTANVADIATHETAGIVKPDYDFDIAADGTLSLYKAMQVTAWEFNGTTYSVKYKIYEKGAKVTGISLGWALNKEPAQQLLSALYDATSSDTYIENMDIGTTARGTDELTGDALTRWTTFANREFTIIGGVGVGFIVKAVDGRGASSTRQFVLNGYNGVYTGAAAAPAAIDGTFIQTLTKSLQYSKGITFTVNAADGQYIWYACPTSYGTPAFKVGGFDGGFSQVATLDYTNPSDYTESYQVWRSDNAGLGSTTVVVS